MSASKLCVTPNWSGSSRISLIRLLLLMPDELTFPDSDKVFPARLGAVKPIQMAASGAASRVLIGNEDPIHTLSMFEALVKEGYQVTVAVTGTDAIEELRKPDHPPVAILEANLSGINGAEICARMRSTEKDLYLILTGESLTTEEVTHGLDSGADLYLPKSVFLSELLAYIRVGMRALDRKDV